MKNEHHPRTILEAFGCDANSSDPIRGPYHGEAKSALKFIAIVMLVLVAIMASIHLYAGSIDDYRNEFVRADLMQVDQMDKTHQQTAIKDCRKERGDGVAPKFDTNDVVTGCGQRRK
jgi:hypothetical protein